MSPLHPLLALLLGVLVLPILGGGLGAWAGWRLRDRGLRWGFALGLGVGAAAGLTAAQWITLTWPQWPALSTPDWLTWAAWFAAVSGGLLSVVGGSEAEKSGSQRRIRLAAGFGLSVAWAVLVYGDGAALEPLALGALALPPWGWPVVMGGGAGVVWWLLAGLLRRQSPWAGLVTLCVLGSAAAGLLVWGRTVVVAQLVGSATAALGGAALVVALLARRTADAPQPDAPQADAPRAVAADGRGESQRGLLQPLAWLAALILATAVTQAWHYAALAEVVRGAVSAAAPKAGDGAAGGSSAGDAAAGRPRDDDRIDPSPAGTAPAPTTPAPTVPERQAPADDDLEYGYDE